MIYSLHSFIIFIIFMIYFGHSLAEKWISELVIPSNDTTKTCKEWMEFYDLGGTGKQNQNKALNRNREVDGLVHVWTVSYASYLATFTLEERPFGPYGFCELYLSHYKTQKYEPLNAIKMTCNEWISFLGYNKIANSIKLSLILRRNKNEDNFNSIWATSYARFIQKYTNKATMNADEFCNKIGKNDPNQDNYKMAFMNIKSTLLTCEEWIKIYGFSDNITANIQKAVNQSSKYDETMNKWAKSYIQFLRNSENSDDVIILNTPGDYCKTTFGYTIEAIHFEYES